MNKILILIICLPISLTFAQNSSINVSGTSSVYLFENNSICADEITVQQDASFTAEFYGDVFEGNCTTLLTPTGDGTVTLPVELTDIESLPTVFTLKPAYPNPFNPTTNIKYGIPEMCNVKIILFNLQGQIINTLFDNLQEAGWYTITWNGLLDNGNTAAAGIYFMKILSSSNNKTDFKTIKISLIK